MKHEELDVVTASPPCQSFRSFRWRQRFVRPDLRIWSINLAEDQAPELTYEALIDLEREARISALSMLVCSYAATPLWRRICSYQMLVEIRARSDGRRLVMELALQEAMR